MKPSKMRLHTKRMKTTDINNIEKIIGYAFKDTKLLERAFVHSSYANEKGVESYDRMEFLGDGVLGLIIAEMLYFKGEDEGNMTEKRSRIVSTKPLEESIETLGLEQFMLFGAGEKKQRHTHRKVLADLFEAIIGAIYLDGGYDHAKKFVLTHLGERISETFKSHKSENPKGDLQEYCQGKKLGKVQYKLISTSGRAHDLFFTVEVCVDGKPLAQGEGKRKKEAESMAATKALKIIRKA